MKILMILMLPLALLAQVQEGSRPDTASARQENRQEVISIAATADTLEPNWSFGVLYTPISSDRIYQVYYYPYYDYVLLADWIVPPYPYPYPYPVTHVTENIEPQMEAQLTLRHPRYARLRVTFDFSYTRTYTHEQREEHVRYIDASSYYDDGSKNTDDMKLFRLSIGFKYYLSVLAVHKVSPYIHFGGGKQLAFVTHRTADLYPSPDYTETDNAEKYLEELNSPVHIFLGFGVEYPFNKSLALFATARFYYSWADSKYDYRFVNDYRTETRSSDSDVADLVKRVGLGFNFYF
jgi:hypothetical protein